MSYNDDDELKIGEFEEGVVEEEDLELIEPALDEPLEDELLPIETDEDDDEFSEDFAGIDGSATDY